MNFYFRCGMKCMRLIFSFMWLFFKAFYEDLKMQKRGGRRCIILIMQGIAYLHKDMKYRCIINLFLHKHCPDSCIIKYRNSDWQSDSLKRNQEVFIKAEKFPLSINWCHSVLRVCSLILDKQHHKSVTMKDVLIVN